MSIRKIEVDIEGISPVLFNRFTEEAQIALEARTTGKRKTVDDKMKEAETKVYRKTPRGNLIIPKTHIKKSMLEGCGFAGFKIGRRSAAPFIRATVFVNDDMDLGVKKPDGIHECTGRIPPGPKGKMVVIRRPYLDTGWKASFGMMATDDRVDLSIIEGSIREAGLVCGLCDHRPEFGRFIVKRFEVVGTD